MNNIMAPDLLHILQHSLGLDQYGRGTRYRNYFSTGEGSADFPKCSKLVEFGYMTDRGPIVMNGGDHIFHVTPAGIDYVSKNSPKPPKLTRAQKRYQDFLKADCGWPFGYWLRFRCDEAMKGSKQ
jgi:hypothetical protein